MCADRVCHALRLGAVVLAFLCSGGTAPLAQVRAGEAAKPFRLELVQGGELSLADCLGRAPVLLVFISISCFECDEIMPVISKVMDRYHQARKLEVVYIALANRKGARWIERFGKYDPRAPLLVGTTSGDFMPTADDYGVEATPSLVLVGRDGLVRWSTVGRVSFETLDSEVQKILSPSR